MLRTDRRTGRPKPICPLNFFEVGGIINVKHDNFDFDKVIVGLDGDVPRSTYYGVFSQLIRFGCFVATSIQVIKFELLNFCNKSIGILNFDFFMPPTSKKLRGHIGLSLSVCTSVRLSVTPFVGCKTREPLQLGT